MKEEATVPAILIAAVLLVATGCSRPKVPGKWSIQETGFEDAFYSVNFVDKNVGWINAQADRSYIPTEEELANSNANRRSTPPAAKPEDPLKANQGFEVLQTTDGGSTWRQIPDQFKHKIRSVWFADAANGWALTIDRDILHTVDGGADWWLQRKAGTVKLKLIGNRRDPYMDQPDQIDRIHFIDAMTGWAWGGGKKNDYTEQPGILLKTVDGGANWDEISYPFGQNIYSIFFLDSQHAWASTEGDGFHRSTDGGLSWTRISGKQPEEVFRAVFFLDPNHGWIVGRSGRMAKTDDGGSTWHKMYLIKDEFKMRDVYFSDSDHGWAVGEGGAILFTADGGETWLSLDSPFPAELMDVAFVDGYGWAAGLSGILLRFEPDTP